MGLHLVIIRIITRKCITWRNRLFPVFKGGHQHMGTRIEILITSKKIRVFGIILNIILPYFIVLAITKLNGADLASYFPAWNDEYGWWLQADAIAQYGRPLGYWGYNGGTPQLGTFGPWGWAMPYLYGIFGAIFGWEYHSYIYANILFSCLSVAIFILLTKPSSKGIYILLAINLLQVVRNLYSFTAMSETGRHAIALIGVGLVYYIFKNPDCNRWIKYGLVPIWIVYCTQAYSLLAILFFLYICCLMRGKKWYVNLCISGIATVIYGIVSYKILMLTVTPYVVTTTGFAYTTLKNNILSLLNILSAGAPFYQLYIVTYLFTILALVLVLAVKWKEMHSNDKIIYSVATFFLVAWLGAFICLYAASESGMIRGLSIAVLLATFLMVLAKNKTPIYVFLICTVMTVFVSGEYAESFFTSGRYATDETIMYYEQLEEKVSSVMKVAEDAATPWENTVVNFLGGSQLSLALPSGLSYNGSFDGTVITDAKYAYLEKSFVNLFADADEILNNYLNNGFELTSVNGDDVVILINSKYT